MPFVHDTAIPFTKMNGSGNDFVLIDHRQRFLERDVIPDFVRAACRRGTGIGADGVVLIEDVVDNDDVDFHWRYLNADGSVGEMCGNGAMCGARFALVNGIAASPARFLTPDGVVTAEIDDPTKPQVRIAMSNPSAIRQETLDVEGTTLKFFALKTGVPHAVAFVADADAFADAPTFHHLGRGVRMHDTFQPAGTNVNVVHQIDAHTLRMRTYERGVEAETLACGTGAVASAVVAASQGLVEAPVTVITSSGRPLQVRWSSDGSVINDVWLGGDARIVATGTLEPEGWLP